MPSIHYYNQTAPFWDFVASMEEPVRNHPFAPNINNDENINNKNNNSNNNNNNNNNNNSSNNNRHEHESTNPWEGPLNFPFGPFAFRGRHGHGLRGVHEYGPPPPPPPPQPPHSHDHDIASGEENEYDPEAGTSQPKEPSPPFSERPRRDPRNYGPHRHAHHNAGFGGRGGRCRERAGWGAWGDRRGSMGGFNRLAGLAEMFQAQLLDNGTKFTEDFTPQADVFDAPESFVVHVSLPGAKKEDVGVNWDAEKSELSIAGVIYRSGDEELLKTLAMDERNIGAFERKIRLGSRANPAQIDVDGISAKMEDGVLRVEVPRMDGGFVEIRKVDIE